MVFLIAKQGQHTCFACEHHGFAGPQARPAPN